MHLPHTARRNPAPARGVVAAEIQRRNHRGPGLAALWITGRTGVGYVFDTSSRLVQSSATGRSPA